MSPSEPDELHPRVLRLARQSLLAIASCTALAASAYVYTELRRDNAEAAAQQVFELVKVGLLPLAVLVLTHYFRTEHGDRSPPTTAETPRPCSGFSGF